MKYVDVRDEAGKLLGTLPMDHIEWWRHGNSFRFLLEVDWEKAILDGPDTNVRLEEATLARASWCPGGGCPGSWCLMATTAEAPKLSRISGFQAAHLRQYGSVPHHRV